MRREDAQTLAVFMFEQGMTPPEIDKAMLAPEGFACEAITEWWALMSERQA